MLAEIAHFLTTPAPAALRRLGYVRESVSLLARSRRCRHAWAPHLGAARDCVLDAFRELPRRRVAVVLGSGLLDDVPLAALAAGFAEVRLVDAVHPWPTRRAVRRFANVRLVSADIGGTTDLLLGRSERLVDPLPDLCGGPEVDFVVSANLLSQLPILPLDRLGSRGREGPPGLGRRIVAAHLRGLADVRARVCLVTDIEEREYDRRGAVTERLDLMHGLVLPPPDRAWDWDLAPFGEAARDRRTVHAVRAYGNWGAACRGAGLRWDGLRHENGPPP